MDNFHYRLNLEEERNLTTATIKEYLKIAKFGWEMLYNTENIALRSLQNLYIFVLRADNFPDNFGPNVVAYFKLYKFLFYNILQSNLQFC